MLKFRKYVLGQRRIEVHLYFNIIQKAAAIFTFYCQRLPPTDPPIAAFTKTHSFAVYMWQSRCVKGSCSNFRNYIFSNPYCHSDTKTFLFTPNPLGQFLLRYALLGDISFGTEYEHKPLVQSALNLQETIKVEQWKISGVWCGSPSLTSKYRCQL